MRRITVVWRVNSGRHDLLVAVQRIPVDDERQVTDEVVQAHSAANATATSPRRRRSQRSGHGSRAASLRPSARGGTTARTGSRPARRHPPPRRGHRLVDQRLDVDALRWGVPEDDTGAAELPVRPRDARRLRRVVHPCGDRRATVRGVEQRQRVDGQTEGRDAEGLENSTVAGTSSRLFTPEKTITASVRAIALRSAETSGGSGYPRWTPPRPPVPMARMPAARAAARVPPTVVPPTAPATAHAPRSRGPTLRASVVKRSSSSGSRPIRTTPSSTPTVAGTAPAARTRRSLSSATATPSGAGKPCATRVVRARRHRDLPRGRSRSPPRSSAAAPRHPSLPRHGAWLTDTPGGRLERQIGPPSSQPAVSASPAPVASTTTAGSAVRSSPSKIASPGTAFQDPRRAVEPATDDLLLVLVREDHVGEPDHGSRNRSGPTSRITLHEERSTLTRAPRSRARTTASIAAKRIGSRASAYPEMWT